MKKILFGFLFLNGALLNADFEAIKAFQKAMMARDRGAFEIAGVVLAYPVLDMLGSWSGFAF